MDIVYRGKIGRYLQLANGPKNNESVGIFMKLRRGAGWSDYQPPSIALPPLPEPVNDRGKDRVLISSADCLAHRTR